MRAGSSSELYLARLRLEAGCGVRSTRACARPLGESISGLARNALEAGLSHAVRRLRRGEALVHQLVVRPERE